jgi:serine/threonine protein kinase
MNIEALVGKVLGTCTLQSVIGQGETGTVFLAQQSRPRRQVAVKVLHTTLPVAPRQRAAVLQRIRHEIDVIASLEHPNIIQIHEYGEHHSLAYLVMPHINGGTLHDEIARRGPLPLQKVVFYLEQLAAALDYAHKRNIIHYGIKPANILIQRGGRLLLTDFGQLKRQSSHTRLSRNSPATSSLAYAAPEQAIGNGIDTRSNLYSLGVILYQMVTGTVPFKNGRAAHHQHIRPQSPRVFRPDLPAAAEQVMLKALAAQPADRYQHVQEFSGAFREALIVADIPLADLSSMFISAGLSDPHIPIPQRPLEIKQQLPHQARQQKSPEAAQQQHQTTDNRESDVLVDTAPTLHIMKKNTLKRREDDHISTDAYPTIHAVNETMLKRREDAHASTDAYPTINIVNKNALASPEEHVPIDTSPAIQQIHKDMLQHDQSNSISSINTPPTIHAVHKNAHQDDIVARTRLTLPSLTSFLSPFPHSQSSTPETPPALSAEQPAIEQKASLLPDEAEPQPQLADTGASVQAISTTESRARLQAKPALLPAVSDTSRDALIEQAVTIPPVNRPILNGPINYTERPAATSGKHHATFPTREKPINGVQAPAKRASLFFLVGIVLLVILILATFAYMTSAHLPSLNTGLSPRHHSTKHTSTNITTTTFSKPGSKSFHVDALLQLTIKGHNSNVSIHTGDASTATVTTSIPASNQAAANNMLIQYTQSVDQQGRDHLDIAANPPSSGIDYTITTPAATQIRVEITSGSIAVTGINGVTISTGSGNLSIADIHGPVDAYTKNGDIIAHGINGQVQMMSVNGSIRANNINGSLQAITQNGDVVVEDATLNGQSTLETTNGTVRFAGTIDPLGTYKMLTNRGNIDLTLPNNVAFQLAASTHSGSIHNAFDTIVTGAAPRAPIMITIGNGGSITINKATV